MPAAPPEYFLNAVTTVLFAQTRVSDLHSHRFDQIQELLNRGMFVFLSLACLQRSSDRTAAFVPHNNE